MIQYPSRTDLVELMQHESGRCVSILMPTHETGRDVNQNSIRFKNLITEAIDALREDNACSELRGRLKKLAELEHDSNFWQHQSKGLALFVCDGFEQTWQLAVSPGEHAVLGEHFFIRPLVASIWNLTRTLTLALSWKNARLFEFDRDTVQEVVDDIFPVAKSDLVAPPVREDRLQFSTQSAHGSVLTSGHAKATPMFHGQGSGEDGIEADRANYISRINERLDSLLYGSDAQLILMATVEVAGQFTAATGREVATVIHGSPEGLSDDQIKQRIIESSHASAASSTHEVCERLKAASANNLAATEIDQVVLAAADGRVDTLLLADEKVRPGKFEREKRTVQPNENAETDLVNIAVRETLKTGGSVLQLDPADCESSIAAIFRY